MRSESMEQGDGTGPVGPAGMIVSARARYTRRQVLGGVSTGAAVGAAAWVVPEILTAKPAAGATLSGGGGPGAGGASPTSGVTTAPSSAGSSNTPSTASDVSTGPARDGGAANPAAASGTLAFTGVDIERDLEVGAAMVASGWALHQWASRTPKAAGVAGAAGAGAVGGAGSRAGRHAKTGAAGSQGDSS